MFTVRRGAGNKARLDIFWHKDDSRTDSDILPSSEVIEQSYHLSPCPTIRSHFSGFKIHWVSEKPVFSADGTMAWMRGADEITVPGPDGKLVTLRTRGISIWRRTKGGPWLCVADVANEAPSPPVTQGK